MEDGLEHRGKARTRRLAASLALLALLAIGFAATAAVVDRHSLVPALASAVSFCPFDDFALHAALSIPALASLPAPAASASCPKLSAARDLSCISLGVPLSRAPPKAPAV